jgi:hypothetical protein
MHECRNLGADIRDRFLLAHVLISFLLIPPVLLPFATPFALPVGGG